MPVVQVVGMIAGVGLLLLLDVMTRRARYYDPHSRPFQMALVGAVALAAAWLAAGYFGGAGLSSGRAVQAAVLGALWFVAAGSAGVLLRRSAIRAAGRRK